MGLPYAEVIGDPVTHSKSPLLHKFWLGKLGIEGDYRATRVTADALPAWLESRRTDPDWRGCNVTMPLKETAFRLVTVDPITRRIGALNTIVNFDGHVLGTNTDRQGIFCSIELYLRPGRVAIIGTGGAARAALEECRQAKVPFVTLVSRSEAKAMKLLEAFGLSGEVAPLGSAPVADLLINASPLGMSGHPPLDIDLAGLAPGATVFDLVYEPLDTSLLQAARARGLRTIDGLTMLINQAAMAFTYFFRDSPEATDAPDLRELLIR